ncbi:MAG: L,D-transpeptidase family protein [Marinibacterium sp.]|nr:L,D-transpeptidase family protein [Marinibacterium sp.]
MQIGWKTLLFCGAMAIFGALPGLGGAAEMGARVHMAQALRGDAQLADIYRNRGYDVIWTGAGPEHQARRAALFAALDGADLHGLPAVRYDLAGLQADLKAADDPKARAALDVAMTRSFLRYARDIQTGVVIPSRIDSGIVRQIDYADRQDLVAGLMAGDPHAYLAGLAPQSSDYRALMKHKLLLERVVARGGWGRPVRSDTLRPGDSGPAVVALRDRLVRMGYLRRTPTAHYDATMQSAVQAFQAAHGLETDGVAGPGTLAELNRSAHHRLAAVVVAMERERWLPRDLGARHIKVNLTDFHAQIMDDGKLTYETRSVIGKNTDDRRTPEFSDVMDHMVINPTWYVPRSIVTKEYLPKLKRNRNAHSYLEITDSRGRKVSRGAVNFAAYSARSFPYAMRQPPGKRNALGRVKFMFPNKYNIYLHDTPQKSLFARESRAFSHGCIRLNEPYDFAYALLALQQDDPEGYFQSILVTEKERRVDLDQPVPVHLIYRTAVITPRGGLEFRRDVYGRDAAIGAALAAAGVALPRAGG